MSTAHICRSRRKLIVVFLPLSRSGGGLGASSAPPIQRTRPTPPRRRSKNESPGLRSCGHCDGYPCARERPNLAITRARDVHEWGNTRKGWEGGDGVVWSDFRRVRHGCESDLESGETDLL